MRQEPMNNLSVAGIWQSGEEWLYHLKWSRKRLYSSESGHEFCCFSLHLLAKCIAKRLLCCIEIKGRGTLEILPLLFAVHPKIIEGPPVLECVQEPSRLTINGGSSKGNFFYDVIGLDRA